MQPTIVPPGQRPRRLRMWLAAGLAILAIAASAFFLAIPWLVNLPFVKDRIAQRVNAILAPGSVSFERISVSWFGPSEATRVALIDPENRRVVTAPRATLDWSLFQILFARPKVANITLIEGRADIVREPGGEINLIDAIRPILVPKPDHTVIVRFEHGTLQFRDSPTAAPLVGQDADIRLDFAAYPDPITWDVKLAQPPGDGRAGHLAFAGKVERVTGEEKAPDLSFTLSGDHWDLASSGLPGSTSGGTIGGALEARRQQGRWSSSGHAAIQDFEAKATAGAMPPVRVASGKADWKVTDSPTGWVIEQVRVESPIATLDAKGTVERKPGADWIAALTAELSNFDFPNGRDPAQKSRDTLKTALKLAYNPTTERIVLSDVDLALPQVRVRGGGSVVGLTSRRAVDLRGTLEPDWPSLRKLLAEKVEPNAQLSGRPRKWTLAGTIPSLDVSELTRTLEGEAGLELDQLDVFGMRLSRTAIVGRLKGGNVTIDPIDSTLNGGPLHLEPEIFVDASGNRSLKLGTKSQLVDAEVNEEVSHRVLSYVAPVMDKATRVSGKVSVDISEAIFPLGSFAGAPKPKVEGEVSFEQVEFAPGPFADMILDVLARDRRPTIVLNEPVSLTIVDGRVYQEGLLVPVGKAAEIGMKGWVGFDRTLDLTASLTLTPEKSGTNNNVLTNIFQGTRFAFPITGTLDDPKLDPKALGQNFKDMGAGLLGRTLSSATGGIIPNVEGLKNLFGGGRKDNDPDAIPDPPKPRVTPEERRARRQERKLERMRKRGEVP